MVNKKVTTRLPIHKEKNWTFTKTIVAWSMIMTTIHYTISQYGTYVLDKNPSEITTELVKILIIGVILGYMSKSGFEFYQNKKTEIATLSCDIDGSGSTTNNENI